MAKMTEIYTCRKGQELKQGHLYTTPDAMSKPQAEVDAREKCQADHTISKVAYFIVDDTGDDKHLYTYKAPDVMLKKRAATKEPTKAPAKESPEPGPQPKHSAPSLLSRVVSWALTEDDGKPAAKKSAGPKDDDIGPAGNTKAKASKPKKKQSSMLSRVVSAALTEDAKK